VVTALQHVVVILYLEEIHEKNIISSQTTWHKYFAQSFQKSLTVYVSMPEKEVPLKYHAELSQTGQLHVFPKALCIIKITVVNYFLQVNITISNLYCRSR